MLWRICRARYWCSKTPALELLERGYVLRPVSSPVDRPDWGTIGYLFRYSEINISMQVAKGVVEAGAYSDQDWQDEKHTPRAIQRQLRIFHRTRALPRMLELVRGDWEEKRRNRLRQILLQAHRDPAGIKALKAYQNSRRFEALGNEDRDRLQAAQRLFVQYQDFLLSP